MIISQSFYLLYYASNIGLNESYKKALLNFAYFATEFSFPSNLNFNLLSRIWETNILLHLFHIFRGNLLWCFLFHFAY